MDSDEETFEGGKQPLHDIKETPKAGGADVAREAHAATDDIRQAAADATVSVREAGARVGRHARAAAASAKVALDDAAETAAVAAEDVVHAPYDRLIEWQVRAENYLREKPWLALVAAAGVGLVAGLWLQSSRRRRSAGHP